MEKNAAKFKRRLCKGLLIFLGLQLFARAPGRSELKNLIVKADSDVFFTATENGYTLSIPGIDSSDIQTDLPSLPAGVKFLSSKKEEFFDENGEKGTRVHIWFSSTDTGIPKLPPLIAVIKNRTYYLAFQSVPVYENPNLISPLLSVAFDDESRLKTDRKTGITTYSARTGEEIHYRIYIQYFQQILHYSWSLPKDSIFTELKRYPLASGQLPDDFSKKEFTPRKFPVAEFSWKPLQEGFYQLPPLQIEAVSYNGSRKQITLPAIIMDVKKGRTSLSSGENPANQYLNMTKKAGLESAFTEKKTDVFATIRYTPTAEDCRTLSVLRTKERHSPFWSDSRQNRMDFERSLGLAEQENESKNPLVHLFGPDFAIFAGGEVSPVPEERSLTHHAAAAQRVKVIERAGNWCYVENRDFSGWVKASLIFEIK